MRTPPRAPGGNINLQSFQRSCFNLKKAHKIKTDFAKREQEKVKILFCFKWRKTALQCCVSFCHITTWISHDIHTSSPSWASLPSLLYIPLGHHRAPGWVPSVIQQLFISYLFYTWRCIYVNATFSIRPTLSLAHCVHKSIVYICFSIPSPQIGSLISFF